MPQNLTFDRLTETTPLLFTVATMEAENLKHGYVGTEHLLLALLREDGHPAVERLRRDPASRILRDAGLSSEATEGTIKARATRETPIPREVDGRDVAQPFTAQLEAALGSAIQRWRTVGPAHILCAVLDQPETAFREVLDVLRVPPDALRDALMASVGDDR
jgi:ATP-dependent Clp protease ATP-binding subunit ClpC